MFEDEDDVDEPVKEDGPTKEEDPIKEDEIHKELPDAVKSTKRRKLLTLKREVKQEIRNSSSDDKEKNLNSEKKIKKKEKAKD